MAWDEKELVRCGMTGVSTTLDDIFSFYIIVPFGYFAVGNTLARAWSSHGKAEVYGQWIWIQGVPLLRCNLLDKVP
jgi:hypothetical protein